MYRFELSANCSLSARQAVGVFAGIAGVSLTIAVGCALMGYWPVLPFAGLELALFGWAMRHTWRRAQRCERVLIDAQSVVIERYDADLALCENIELPRAWAKAALISDRENPGQTALAIGQRGRWVAFGRFLDDTEKRTLLRRLQQVLRDRSQSAD